MWSYKFEVAECMSQSKLVENNKFFVLKSFSSVACWWCGFEFSLYCDVRLSLVSRVGWEWLVSPTAAGRCLYYLRLATIFAKHSIFLDLVLLQTMGTMRFWMQFTIHAFHPLWCCWIGRLLNLDWLAGMSVVFAPWYHISAGMQSSPKCFLMPGRVTGKILLINKFFVQ